MQFGRPEFLYALLLLPLMAVFLMAANFRRKRVIARLGDPGLMARLSASVNHRGRSWRLFLWFVSLTLIIIALARPQWGSEVESVQQQGIEIMIALDVSDSMLAEDFKPNRLSRAKLEIVDLMERLVGDEIGLVPFAGASFIQFPLTSDFATARTYLDNADPNIISRPGTDIGGAIRTALRGFNEQRATQKVIIIFTDGESHQGGVLDAAAAASEQGAIIYAIGFGSPQGQPIPDYNDQGVLIGYRRDAEGETILSVLDEATLQQIALATGGQYYRATANGREIVALVNELDNLQTSEFESSFQTRRVERFQWFLAAALLALVISEFIPDRLKGLARPSTA